MKIKQLFVTAALITGITGAWAGAHFAHEVAVSDNYIRGSVSTAASSQDSKQYIGCYINSYDTGSAAVCIGRDASGKLKFCIDNSPNQATLNAVSAISDSSYIYAAINDGKCTRISVHASSAFNG